MRDLFAFLIFIGIVACTSQEDGAPTIPLEIALRKTTEEIQDIQAFLDVEVLKKEGNELVVFSFEIQGNVQEKRLVPANDLLICSFLNEQLMYGMGISEDCASSGYYYRYLKTKPNSTFHRLHVTISGQVKERHPSDLFTGMPILLNGIKKIQKCPIQLFEKPESIPFENQFWKLVGFTDKNKNLISFPTCEDPNVGIIFHDKILEGTPIDDPLAKSFTIQSAVWTRPDQFFAVYNYSEKNTLIITRGLNGSYMPPRPATSPTNNYASLTKDIVNTHLSINKLFVYLQPVEFTLEGNKLWLSNPASDIHAQFIFDSSKEN